VHHGRLLLVSFRFGPSLRCIASFVCLGSLSATSLSLPFSVSVALLSPLLSSARPTPYHLCGSAFVYCLHRRCVCRGASSSEITSPSMSVCALHPFPFLPYFLLFFQVGLPLAVSASAYPVLPLLHQVWLMSSGFRLSISTLCVCHSRTLSYIPSAAPPPHIVLFYPYDVSPVSLKFTLFPLFR